MVRFYAKVFIGRPPEGRGFAEKLSELAKHLVSPVRGVV
jgi:hypothetical protein